MKKIMLFILSFSLVVLQSSCDLFKKDDAQQTDTTDTSDEATSEDDYNIDEYGDLETSEDEFDEEDLADLLEEDTDPAGDTTTGAFDEETTSQPTTSDPDEYVEEPVDRSVGETTPTSFGGDYMVIAGNFSNEGNAQSLVDQLKGLGYPDAEIVYFKAREFHTVCAGKYDSRSDASTASNDLKNNHNIETYVHKRR